MGNVCVLQPTKLKRSLSFWLRMRMEKLPLMSVTVASMIRPVPSISHTEAPGSPPMSSLTVPCTLVICAWQTDD